jgi:5-methylcytosine-specific restriction endonuclease McrA
LEKISEALVGSKSPNWKPEIHTDEKVECACGCGKLLNKYSNRGIRRYYIKGHNKAGQFKTGQTTGEKNRNWKGGVTSENNRIRKSEEYINWRKAVYIKDRYTCQKCGHQYTNIVAHHIKSFEDFPELRFDVENGMVLCRSCHLRLHRSGKGKRCNAGRGGCGRSKKAGKGKR